MGRKTSHREEPFVGRERELAHLKDSLRLAVEGSGRMEMLVGEPGIGKTRLAEELAAHASVSGVRVLTGRCYPEGGSPAYWPWIQALEPLFVSADRAQLKKDLGHDAALAATAFPRLAERLPDLGPILGPSDDAERLRFRLFQAAEWYLHAVSQRQPLLIVLDDLHWADEGSLRMLVFVARELARNRIMVVGTYRDVELERKHPLSRVLGELVRERLYERHQLRGLDAGEVERYLRASVGGEDATGELARVLYEQTDGNPLFVTQMARLMADQEVGALGCEEGRAWLAKRLPEGVREAIGGRLDALSAKSNEALETAALFTREFTAEELATALGWPVEEAAAALEESAGARIVEEEEGKAAGRYRFVHLVIRETLAREIALGRQVRLQAWIGEALEAGYGSEAPAHAAELAMHFGAAQSVVGAERYARWALTAGEQALKGYAYEEALRHARGGLEALKGRPMDDLQAELLLVEGRALDSQGSHDAGELYRRVMEYYESSGQATKALAVAGHYPVWQFEPEVYERLLALAAPGTAAEGRVLANYGVCLRGKPDSHEKASAMFEKALAIAQELEDPELEWRARWGRCQLDFMWRRYRSCREDARKMLEIARRQKDPLAEVETYHYLFLTSDDMTQLEELKAMARQMLEVAGSVHDYRLYQTTRSRAAGVAIWAGEWDEARRLYDLIVHDRPVSAESLSWVLSFRARIEYWTGNFSEGKEHLGRLLAQMRAAPSIEFSTHAHGAMAIVLAARMSGDNSYLPYAKSAVEVMLTQSTVLSSRQNVVSCRLWIAILENNRDDLREFYGKYREIMSPQRELGSHEPLGVAARMLGDLDASVEYLRAGKATRTACLFIHAGVCHELAETLFLRGKEGDRQEAASLWKETLELAERIELEPLARRVKARLAEAFPPAFPDGLSPREVEVLRLVARGNTNKEIATELFISEKTVQNHLASIFVKTGAGNRTEAAGYALKRGIG